MTSYVITKRSMRNSNSYRYLGFIYFVGEAVTGMLNKNTWGVKKCEANQKQHC